ncbi:TetR/AcrR family transcriptional regulator [Nocardioides yefusunii]|uniref:TetR/AcrR family transcriptional regulator n=1 Tax=Nocardioides yefusunii TaxID=2500546 RepID=A0ABW1QWI3_9ACTN|nr:TetR/AcrR family transcriptional regulator [Nocardioides yefusunii]
MAAGPRERLVTAAIELVRRDGVEGAALADILERGGVARRSVYQHFPGGKAEMVSVATGEAGRRMRGVIATLGAGVTPSEMLDGLVRRTADDLRRSDFALGCPVMAAANSADVTVVRAAAAEVFDLWIEEISAQLVSAGRPATEAQGLAGFVVSSIEGALARARAARSVAPLEEAAAFLVPLVAAVGDAD